MAKRCIFNYVYIMTRPQGQTSDTEQVVSR